eukprot:TRINITY_DN19093_c0_g1_i3.p1 TRINITY_DN19093_c0_g1~~TRINITY_DN19093_c0_g1_i3.p1  ORF type:complete len:146 (-),score=33.41 TRINITY_DN19093_c0_g1_i3:327-764(-)
MWLHFIFPHECPYPYYSGDYRRTERKEEHVYSESKMRQHVTESALRGEKDDRIIDPYLHWDFEEDLLAQHSRDAPIDDKRAPGRSAGRAGRVASTSSEAALRRYLFAETLLVGIIVIACLVLAMCKRHVLFALFGREKYRKDLYL